MKSYHFVLPIFLGLVLAACHKDDAITSPQTNSANIIVYSNLLADPTQDSGRFQYFRLSDSAIVSFSDSNSLRWDIAFSSTTIHTNGGTSGPGDGGAIVLKSTSFSDLMSAPDGPYYIDTSFTKLAIKTGSGNGWYNYNFSTNIISPVPGTVLALRTADGKYAKMEILSYYKNAPATPDTASTPRYYTFRYLFQSDGSKKLE